MAASQGESVPPPDQSQTKTPISEDPDKIHYENESVTSDGSGQEPPRKNSSLSSKPILKLVPRIYPDLSSLNMYSDPEALNPADQEDLEEEAAKYKNKDWPPFHKPPSQRNFWAFVRQK